MSTHSPCLVLAAAHLVQHHFISGSLLSLLLPVCLNVPLKCHIIPELAGFRFGACAPYTRASVSCVTLCFQTGLDHTEEGALPLNVCNEPDVTIKCAYPTTGLLFGAVLWEQAWTWQREADAYSLRQQAAEFPHHLLTIGYSASSCCWCCVCSQGEQTSSLQPAILLACNTTPLYMHFETPLYMHFETLSLALQ